MDNATYTILARKADAAWDAYQNAANEGADDDALDALLAVFEAAAETAGPRYLWGAEEVWP